MDCFLSLKLCRLKADKRHDLGSVLNAILDKHYTGFFFPPFFKNNDAVCTETHQDTSEVLVSEELSLTDLQGAYGNSQYHAKCTSRMLNYSVSFIFFLKRTL